MPLTRHLHLFCLPSGRSLLCPSFQFMLSMSAKIICWNCRGISARDTCSRILHFIRKDKPWIICLLETRANHDRVDRFCSKLPRCWEWAAILAEGYSSGIIVLWNCRIGLATPVAVSRRALHLILSPVSSKVSILSFVYNSYRLRSQCALWAELNKISPLNLPWLIAGDFNSVLTRDEHKGGSFSYYNRKAHFFSKFCGR